MSNRNFLSRMLPLIDRASEAARGRAKKVITDSHQLWMIYIHERERLLDGAVVAKNGESVDRKDFEAYLISLGGESESTVWAWDADESEDSDDV